MDKKTPSEWDKFNLYKYKFMKKKWFNAERHCSLFKWLRIMKLTLFFLLAALLHVSASVYSQQTKFNIVLRDASVKEVLKQIENQSEYFFLYKNENIDVNRVVNIDIKDKPVEYILDELFKGTSVTYEIVNRQIVLVDKGRNNPFPVIQQQKSISGKVTDSTGAPLPGVTVIVKGTSNGTITDNEGAFSISNVPTEGVLVFSFVGMKTQEVNISGKTSITIKMAESTIGLDEVVAVGYGTMKKSDLTGSVSSVQSKDINTTKSSNALQSLAGRIAGVNISQNTGAPGSTMSIRIRGVNSIQGGNEPLYVIDGFPTNQNMLLSLNNSDIESIEILKDASATAIYGSRGANGVVLITTKQGKAKKTQVIFESSYAVQSIRKKMDLMDATEYALFINEQLANKNLDPYFSQEDIDGFGKGFDWQDALFHQAPQKNVSININGGNEKTQFSLGGSMFLQDGIIRRSDFSRYSVVMNLNHTISDKLNVGVSNVLSYIDTNRKDSGGGGRGNGTIGGALAAPPTLTPYNEDGTYRNLLTAYPFISNSMSNPVNILNEVSSNRNENRILLNAFVLYKPIQELTVKISGGISNTDYQTNIYRTNNYLGAESYASMGASRARSLLNENTVTYDKTFNEKHRFSAIAGLTYQDFVNTSLSGDGTSYISDVTENFDLGAALTPGIPQSGYSKSNLFSVLTRLNYVYNDKYLATFTFRGDGASQYSDGQKWGYFPSGALAWRVSKEKFFKSISAISNLKLRASWGKAGNQAISAYTTLNTLSSGNTIFGDGTYVTYAPGTRLPQNLKWESTATTNLGVDLGFLDNKINLTADYYIKKTTNLLNTVGLPLSMGYTSTIQNIGEMQNKGLEFGIDATPFSGNFKWNLNFNFSINRNKIVKLYNGQDILSANINVNLVQDYINILREGEPVGMFWGYQEDGYDDSGNIKFKDLDGDTQITSKDKTFIGNPNPDFTYGLQSSMSYKDFEFTFFVQGTYGNDIFNASSISSTLDYGIGLNMPEDVYLNHWTPENTNAKYPIAKVSTNVKVSDRFIEDGSYLRLKNVELAYNLGIKKFGMDNLRIYVSGQNLLTLTKYSWWDPEINSLGSAINQGVDYYSYPTSKSFTIGLQARF